MLKGFFRRVFPAKSQTDFPISYIANRFFMERIKAEPVLVVGDYTNRDYFALKKRFNKVYSLDVIDNPGIPAEFFLKQSAEDRLPFADGYFKAILFGEVIENVWRDRDALLEMNRVLAADGTFLISAEFYADEALHYHIYSPNSLKLLLEHAGFEIMETKYSGFITKFFGARTAATAALLLYPFLGHRALKAVNQTAWNLDELFKNSKRINGIFEMSAYVLARKRKDAIDPIGIQAAYYEGQWKENKDKWIKDAASGR